MRTGTSWLTGIVAFATAFAGAPFFCPPRAGSQSYPSTAAAPNADGSTTVYFGPEQPQDGERGSWIQTDPDKGWFTILRLYSPLKPFFDKTWRPSEIELLK